MEPIGTHDFSAKEDDELSFKKQFILNVSNEEDMNWYRAELDGHVGKNYYKLERIQKQYSFKGNLPKIYQQFILRTNFADDEVEHILSETYHNEFIDSNQIGHRNTDRIFNEIECVQVTTNSDANPSSISILNTEQLYENGNYDANLTNMDNFATDMETGLLMEWRPHGNGYPSWVGDFIPVGEPVNDAYNLNTYNSL